MPVLEEVVTLCRHNPPDGTYLETLRRQDFHQEFLADLAHITEVTLSRILTNDFEPIRRQSMNKKMVKKGNYGPRAQYQQIGMKFSGFGYYCGWTMTERVW
jgi:hypothetical protein